MDECRLTASEISALEAQDSRVRPDVADLYDACYDGKDTLPPKPGNE